jgi:hypothetical protein
LGVSGFWGLGFGLGWAGGNPVFLPASSSSLVFFSSFLLLGRLPLFIRLQLQQCKTITREQVTCSRSLDFSVSLSLTHTRVPFFSRAFLKLVSLS